jgi:hypothetical protein
VRVAFQVRPLVTGQSFQACTALADKDPILYFANIRYNSRVKELTNLGMRSLTEEQRRFFEELLQYLRDELEARKDPAAVEQRVQMFAALAGETGRARVLRDKRLAEEGFVYLSEKGKRRLKHVVELTPLDVPAVLAEMENTAAISSEYIESDGVVYVIEYGGRKLITPDPGDPSVPLRARWRELKDGWHPLS